MNERVDALTPLAARKSHDSTQFDEARDCLPEPVFGHLFHTSILVEPVLRKPKFSTIVEAMIGRGTIIRDHVNLYKCKIGRNCKIESFVYVEENVKIGDSCKIKPHVFIPSGVTIEDEVFIGPGVTFTNDKYPRAKGRWKLLKTYVGRGASIGANSVILPGVRIGKNASVGAGSVVTKDVPDDAIVWGNPALSARTRSKSV